jgi:hypothetical protein
VDKKAYKKAVRFQKMMVSVENQVQALPKGDLKVVELVALKNQYRLSIAKLKRA